MKRIIITIALAFIVSAGIAQSKAQHFPNAKSDTVGKPAVVGAERQYVIQLGESQLNNLFSLIYIARSLQPYAAGKPEGKLETQVFIDHYLETIRSQIKEIAPPDTIKKK